MDKRSNNLIKNTIIFFIGIFCTKGIIFFMTPLFTRWLLQKTYGTFDLLCTYVSLLVPLVTLCFGEALYRYLMKEETNKKYIINNAFVVSIISIVISSIILIIIGLINIKIRNIILLFFLLLLSEIIYNFMTMLLRGLKNNSSYVTANIIYSISMAFFVFIMVKILNLKLVGIVLGFVLGYLVSIIYMLIKSNVISYLSFKYLDYKLIKEMFKYSIPLIPNAISWWFMDASDRTIISMYLGTGYSAIISVAHKIPNICNNFYNSFQMSWQQSAIETLNHDDKDKYYSRILNNTIKLFIPLSCIILSINFICFEFLFPKEYYLGYYLTPPLIAASMFAVIAQFLGAINVADMQTKKHAITTMIAAIINVVVHLLLITKIGIYAAVFSTLCSYIVLLLVRYFDIRKNIKFKIKKKNACLFIILIYFTISQYINLMFLHILNIFLSLILFITINKNNIFRILKKVGVKN